MRNKELLLFMKPRRTHPWYLSMSTHQIDDSHVSSPNTKIPAQSQSELHRKLLFNSYDLLECEFRERVDTHPSCGYLWMKIIRLV